jgi:concanavalin A-like lectin/glucanase superfamily protein
MDSKRRVVGRFVLVALAMGTLWSGSTGAAARSSSAFQAAPIPGLAGYWPLNSSAADASGNGNNGTLNSGAVIDNANFSPVPAGNTGSASFPTLGGGNRVDVPDSASLSITGSITVAAWIRTNLPVAPATLPNVDQQEIVGKFVGPPYAGGYYLRLNQNNYLSWNILPSTGGPYGAGGASAQVPTGVWKHVAGTYNQATGAMTVFIDGAANSSTGTSPAPPSDGVSGLIIGRNGSNEFNGNIDEVRVYSRALTQPEVNSLFTGVQPPPTGLSATPGPAQIALSWIAAAVATSYNVYRATGGGAPVLIANTASLSYTDTMVTNPTMYTYTVTAVGALESAPAGPVTSSPLPVLPKTASSGSSNNIAHRCGCSSIAPGTAGMVFGLLALLGLASLARGQN